MSMNVNGSGSGSVYQQQLQKQKQAQQSTAASTSGKTNGEYNQSQYLKELNERVNANVIAGAWNGKSQFGSGDRTTVMVHPDFLRKMHDDPALGEEYEGAINGIAEYQDKARKQLESQGIEITSSGTYIDENGEMSGYTVVTTGGGGDKEMARTDKKKTAKELMEELQEKIMEKREAEKTQAKELASESIDASFQVINKLA